MCLSFKKSFGCYPLIRSQIYAPPPPLLPIPNDSLPGEKNSSVMTGERKLSSSVELNSLISSWKQQCLLATINFKFKVYRLSAKKNKTKVMIFTSHNEITKPVKTQNKPSDAKRVSERALSRVLTVRDFACSMGKRISIPESFVITPTLDELGYNFNFNFTQALPV